MTQIMSFSKGKKTFIAFLVLALLVTGGLFAHLMADDEEIVHIAGIIEEKTNEELFEQSSLAVLGTVTGISDSFQIESTSGSVANFTDYYVTISSTLRGSPDEKTVTVRVQGGTVGSFTEIYEPSPKLKADQEYLLFLYQPSKGGAFNTEGNYYYILGLTQGIFSVEDEGAFRSQVGEELTNETLTSRAKVDPINHDYFRDEYIENQKKNLENGFITQKEYDTLMKNLDVYATIVK